MTGSTISVSIDVPLDRELAFQRVVEELERRLVADKDGAYGDAVRFEPGPDGRLVERRGDEEVEVASVREWQPGERIVLSWRAADWGRSKRTDVEIRFVPAEHGTMVTFEHRGWGAPILELGAGEETGGIELVGWFTDQVIVPLAEATAPSSLGQWLTDRRARRPTGPRARDSYCDPKEHRPGFKLTLAALELTLDDVLLEIGCGGGAFMREALRSGCRVVAIDHSEEMVRLTEETNGEAIAAGRLEVRRASAERLPFEDGAFTAVAMTHVFFFLEHPETALRECRRVLAENGRLAVYTPGPSLRGTPGAPVPVVRWMRLYEPEELEQLARDAGFGTIDVADHGGAHVLLARP